MGRLPHYIRATLMTENSKVAKQHSLSPIWFVPVIAIIIALTLAVRAWQAQGPIVPIYFNEAEGIEPGRTKIRYKNVDVGTVKSIKVSENLTKIVVTAELDIEFSEYLSINTQFWVVSPRISLSGVSGLSTLVSGVYIEVDPGPKGKEKLLFQGLEDPPLVRSDTKGSSYTLFTAELGSLDVGSPVYFKQIKVGEITSYRLSTDKQDIEVTLFVKSPYDELVTDYSRFWNVSGFDVGFGANGINVELESLNALISGGVAFDSPHIENTGTPNNLNSYYILPNQKAVLDGAFITTYSFMMNFPNQSVRGLEAGSPIEYYGINIGQVKHISFSEIDVAESENIVSINVLIEIQPERMTQKIPLDKKSFEKYIHRMVKNGLRGQLKSGSLLTGGLYIDLVDTLNGHRVKMAINNEKGYAFIPTIPGNINEMTRQFASIANKIDEFPIAAIGNNLSGSLSQLNSLLSDLNATHFSQNLGSATANIAQTSDEFTLIVTSVAGSLEQLKKTLATVEESIAPDSQLYFELLETLRSIEESSNSMRQFTDELNRYPQSLILGK
jgi:paraquat-inducible protein B